MPLDIVQFLGLQGSSYEKLNGIVPCTFMFSLAPTLAWFGSGGCHGASWDLVGHGVHLLIYQYSRFNEDIPEEITSPHTPVARTQSPDHSHVSGSLISETKQSNNVDHSPFVVFHTLGMTHLLKCGNLLIYKKQVVCETNTIFRHKMYFFTYLLLIYITLPSSPLLTIVSVSNEVFYVRSTGDARGCQLGVEYGGSF